MKGVKFLKGTPINPVVPEVPKPQGQLQVPGQSMGTAQMAAQSAQMTVQAASRNAQTAAQSAQSIASSIQASGTTYNRPSAPIDLEGLGKTIAGVYATIQESRQKKLEAEQAKLQEQALFDLTNDAEALRRNALDIISSDGGMAAYDTASANLLKAYRDRVPFDEFEKIFSSVTTAGKEAYSTVNGRLYQQSQELQDASVAMKEREALLSNRPLISAMSSVDPIRRQQGWEGVRSYLDNLLVSGEVDMASFFRIGTALLDAANEADIQPELVEAERNRITRNMEAIRLQQEAYERWLGNQTPQGYNQFDLDIATIKAQYPDAPMVAEDPNVFFEQYRALKELERRQEVLISESPETRAALEMAQDFDTNVIEQLALFLVHPNQGRIHTATIQQLEQRAKEAGLTTDWPAVLAQAEYYQNAIAQLPKLNEDVAAAEVNLTKTKLNLEIDAVDRLRKWREATETQQVDNLGMMMVLQNPDAFGIGPELLQQFGGLVSQPSLSPEEAQQAYDISRQLDEAAYNAVAQQYTQALQAREQVVGPLRGVAVQDNLLITEQNGNPIINNSFFNALTPIAQESLTAIQSNIAKVNEQIRLLQQGPPLGMNGPGGGMPSPFKNPPLHRQTIGGIESYLPFEPTSEVIPLTGQFGEDRGTHLHGGVDFAVPTGTPILNYIGGRVEAAGYYGNYGNLVDVRATDGSLHRFAHLSQIDVTVGDELLPGDVLGLAGNTGRSSGPHLHWEVILNAGPDGETGGTKVNPIEWASKNIAVNPPAVRGGSNPSGPQLLNVPLDGGGWYSNGLVYDKNGLAVPAAYTATNPMRPAFAPTRKELYQNNPANNYGYSKVAQDGRFRSALHQMAGRLGIPAQWILDVMALETGGSFDPTITNPRSGAYGLIQFLPETIEGLKYNHPELSSDDLKSGDRVRQLKWVEAYLSEMDNKINTIYDLAVAVFLGEPRLDDYQANPSSIRGLGDDAIGVETYLAKLGQYVGRQYRPMFPTGTEIHTRPVHNCRVCQNMSQAFQPHEVYE